MAWLKPDWSKMTRKELEKTVQAYRNALEVLSYEEVFPCFCCGMASIDKYHSKRCTKAVKAMENFK